MNYGKILKELRKENELTQEEVAKKNKINTKTYSNYEIQENIIPLIKLNKLCTYFDVSIDYILGFTNTKKYNNSKSTINTEILGKRLKEFRKNTKNLTLEKLSNEINIHYSTLAKYENGINLISTSTLYDICKIFNISADYLLGKIDSPKNI